MNLAGTGFSDNQGPGTRISSILGVWYTPNFDLRVSDMSYLTLTFIILSNCSKVVVSTVPLITIPALFTLKNLYI